MKSFYYPSIYLISTFCILLSSELWAQSTHLSIIRDPHLNGRCKELLAKRYQLIEIKRKIKGLLNTNVNLRSGIPPEKINLHKKIYRNHQKLEREYYYIGQKIINLEETLIKRGCPGVQME